jgi:hypothetical protein
MFSYWVVALRGLIPVPWIALVEAADFRSDDREETGHQDFCS